MCGKEEETANLQDLLIFNLKGIAVLKGGGAATLSALFFFKFPLIS